MMNANHSELIVKCSYIALSFQDFSRNTSRLNAPAKCLNAITTKRCASQLALRAKSLKPIEFCNRTSLFVLETQHDRNMNRTSSFVLETQNDGNVNRTSSCFLATKNDRDVNNHTNKFNITQYPWHDGFQRIIEIYASTISNNNTNYDSKFVTSVDCWEPDPAFWGTMHLLIGFWGSTSSSKPFQTVECW